MKFHNQTPGSRHLSKTTSWYRAAAFAVGAGAVGTAFAVGTSAGLTIQNTATATYEDANGNSFESTSNTATIQVAEVYAASIEFDNDVVGAPGSVVYFPHVLRNNGNGTDTFTLTTSQGNTDEGLAANTADCTSVTIVEDQNGNGVADSGEPVLSTGTGFANAGTISVDADDFVDLVVSCQIAGTVAPGSVIGVTLTAEASQDGALTPDGVTDDNDSVVDVTASQGDDNLDGTNENTVTVSGDAVLAVTKQATYNANDVNDGSDDTVTYYIELRNNGVSPAYNVEISDVLDLVDHAVTDISDITGLAVTGAFADGAAAHEGGAGGDWTTGLCEVLADGTGCAGTVGGVAGASVIATNDANGDGTTGDFGVRGHDDVLPSNTTITVQFTVPVVAGLAAGTDINNTVTVRADTNDDGDADDAGETVDADAVSEVPPVYAVDADDTGDALGDNATDPNDTTDGVVNDGGDDDQDPNNDTQTVDTVPAGATVLFNNIITNNGNSVDTLELSIANGDLGGNNPFPTGTVFTFYNASNTSLLADTNLNGSVDTGPLNPGESLPIVVRAQLPDGVFGTGPFIATTTATSNGAAEAGITPAVSDTKLEQLNNIEAPAVDLSNNAADNDSAVDNHNYVQGTNTAITTETGLPGNVVSFDLVVQNDSGSPDSYDLSAGGSFIAGTPDTLGPLPEGWTVVFRDSSGSVVTSSVTIAPNGTETFTAEVSIPSNVSLALADRPAVDVDGDGNADDLDFNADGDGDYAIFFKAESSNTGAYDIKLDGVDVDELEEVSLITDNSGQVAAGGSIDYPHTLRNEGNTVETIVLSSANNDPDWGNGLVVDTTGDGNPDTIANTGVTQVFVDDDNDPATPPVARAVTVDANGNITITLNPGETLPFNDRVFAPSDAAANEANTTTITATYNNGNDSIINEDVTRVVPGQLQLRKFAALDADCNGDIGTETYAVAAGSDVEPEQCVCWLIVATNTGSSVINNVVINDSAPTFTTYSAAGGLSSCAGNEGPDVGGTACTGGLEATTGNAGDHSEGYTATESAGNVTFSVGNLAGGEAASAQFCTEVE